MIGPAHGGLDLFYTLPTALGVPWHFEHALLEREHFRLELVPDVHRDHGIRNAILCIVPSDGIDLFARLAVANAWREGVRHFVIVLCDRSPPGAAADDVEQELRVLLDAVGDGGGAPCIRTAMTRAVGTVDAAMIDAMHRLLAACERVFVPETGEARGELELAPLPARFDREAQILDAIRPAIRAGTRIEKRPATLDETAALRPDGGGSHYAGWPYLPIDEPWPPCPRCRRLMPCFLQLDMRDVLHRPPPAHHLFVVYRCGDCGDRGIAVRHYDSLAAPRLELDDSVGRDDHLAVLDMTMLCHMLPREQSIVRYHDGVVARLRAIDDNWGRLFWFAEAALGMRALRIPDHLGGWQPGVRTTGEERCRICGREPILVSATEWGDWVHSLWACPAHPGVTHFEFHK